MGNIALIIVSDMQIRGIIARPNLGGTFTIKSNIAKEYTGIVSGDFVDKADFSEVFISVTRELRSQITGKDFPTTLYICVPNVFCRVISRGSETVFNRPTQIKKGHVRNFCDSFNDIGMYGIEVVSRDILYYQVDDEDAVIDVMNVTATKVKTMCSVVGISNIFSAEIPTNAINKMGFKETKFVPMVSADVFLVPESVRDAGATMIRSDFFTTSISNVVGDGTISLTFFDDSVGNILSDLMESFSIDYESAATLLKDSAITVGSGKDTNYFVRGKVFPTMVVNTLVMKHVKLIGDRLLKANPASAVYISGGNINDILGVRNMLSNAIDTPIYSAVDPLTKQPTEPKNTINAILRYITCKM